MASVGASLTDARAAMVMVHGRGGTAEGVLALAGEFDQTDVAYVAPQAPGHSWYPYSFLAPLSHNEPGLSLGLQTISEVVDQLRAAGIAYERLLLLGFSQGACLALEYAARNARRYGAVVGLSGGLIGPDGTPRDYAGSLEGTPIFLGCSDVDPHVPLERVHHTEAVFRDLGADVTVRVYEGMGHTVNEDEVDFVRGLLTEVLGD